MPTAVAENQNTLQGPGAFPAGAEPQLQQDRFEQPPAPASAEWGSGEQDFAAERTPARNLLTAPPPDWPALSLQMVFFSEEENRSFVQVNGKTYRQGEQLAAGPQVLGITREGVTLAYRGQLILLGAEK